MSQGFEDRELKAALEALVPPVSSSGKWSRVEQKRRAVPLRPGRLGAAVVSVGLVLIAALAYWGITSLPSDDLLVIDDRPVGEAGECGTSNPDVTGDQEFTISVPPLAEQSISKAEVVVSAPYGDEPGAFGLWKTEMGTTGAVRFGVSPDGRFVVLDDVPKERAQVFEEGRLQRTIPSSEFLHASDLAIDDEGVVYALDQVDGITVYPDTTPSEQIPVPRRADSFRLYYIGSDLYVQGVEDLSFPSGGGEEDLNQGLQTRSGTLTTGRSADETGAYEAFFEHNSGGRDAFRVVPEVAEDFAAILPAGEDRAGNALLVLWGRADPSIRTYLALAGDGSLRGRVNIRMDGDYGGSGLKATETSIYELRNSSTDGVQVIRHELVPEFPGGSASGSEAWEPIDGPPDVRGLEGVPPGMALRVQRYEDGQERSEWEALIIPETNSYRVERKQYLGPDEGMAQVFSKEVQTKEALFLYIQGDGVVRGPVQSLTDGRLDWALGSDRLPPEAGVKWEKSGTRYRAEGDVRPQGEPFPEGFQLWVSHEVVIDQATGIAIHELSRMRQIMPEGGSAETSTEIRRLLVPITSIRDLPSGEEVRDFALAQWRGQVAAAKEVPYEPVGLALEGLRLIRVRAMPGDRVSLNYGLDDLPPAAVVIEQMPAASDEARSLLSRIGRPTYDEGQWETAFRRGEAVIRIGITDGKAILLPEGDPFDHLDLDLEKVRAALVPLDQLVPSALEPPPSYLDKAM